MLRFLPKSFRLFLSTFVPALLIVLVSVYGFAFKPKMEDSYTVLPGKPLASYGDLYPVRVDANGRLFLDKQRFMKAVSQLSGNPSPKAISDLVYLGSTNNVVLMLDEGEREAYKNLIGAYKGLPDPQSQHDRVFNAYKDIVNGIGQSFAGTGIEVVLHDTRNPLKSVVAIQNPIAGRRLGDATTDFGLELIKSYSTNSAAEPGTSLVSYAMGARDGRPIKSSTIPLFHETYGLVGFICMNIDVSQLNEQHPEALARFIENIRLVSGNDKVGELIEKSRSGRVPQ